MHRKIALSGLATVAVATGGILTGVSPASASSGGTISVVYQVQGGTNALTTLVKTAQAEFQKQYPGWTVKLEPITSPGRERYYTKLDLMNQSSSTAPDVMYEDTFLVNSDVAAGYLAPLNSYLGQLVRLERVLARRPGRRPRRQRQGLRGVHGYGHPWSLLQQAGVRQGRLAGPVAAHDLE